MQISRCFAGLQRWDGAITWSEKGLAHAPGPLQRVTARLWRMELFLRLPRLGWRAGESRQLDLDPPTTEPGRTFLAEARTTEHLTQAVSEGTAALADFDSLPAAARQPADEAGLCVDLARTAERIWLEQGALVPPPGSTLGDWGAAPGDAVPAGDWHPLRLSAHYLRQAELRAPAGRKASLCLARAWWLRRHRATLQQSLTPGGPLPS
ncbi:MAG: hypothetical protein FJX77_01545, partial [Armatimonadetes bacterium]|nr:hypothetical protein [Armatimonadota bacterium]